jgi:hypothetical protein
VSINIVISRFLDVFDEYPLKEEKAKVQDEWQVSTPFLLILINLII